ncbi:gp59 [Brochothrix phage A9]|uniref:Gp59 n=1 Tax=Brochothrix phage A9 TaxID=857312 RepID=D9J0K6_9CAUD|nr:gp59 [Brochothrix phage A9]ADJ53099.1 gp59 [Brochothrix phage A9]
MKNRGFCRLPTTGTRSPVSIGFLCCLNNLADHYVQLCLRVVYGVSSHTIGDEGLEPSLVSVDATVLPLPLITSQCVYAPRIEEEGL